MHLGFFIGDMAKRRLLSLPLNLTLPAQSQWPHRWSRLWPRYHPWRPYCQSLLYTQWHLCCLCYLYYLSHRSDPLLRCILWHRYRLLHLEVQSNPQMKYSRPTPMS